MATTNTDAAAPAGRVSRRTGGAPAAAGAGRRGEVHLLSVLGTIALVAWAIIVIAPILWTFLASFKNTSEIFSSPWTLPAQLRVQN